MREFLRIGWSSEGLSKGTGCPILGLRWILPYVLSGREVVRKSGKSGNRVWKVRSMSLDEYVTISNYQLSTQNHSLYVHKF